MSRTITVIIADDEPDARSHICSLFAKETDIEIVAKCVNGRQTVSDVKKLKPDLLFLDIQMPYLDGFEVLCSLQTEHIPVIVFVTAYDNYALKAFEVNAIDYLLKPFGETRFKESLDKARNKINHLRSSGIVNRHEELLDTVSIGEPILRRLIVRRAGRIQFLNIAEANWIDSSGNYIAIHFNDFTHMMKGSLNQIEKRLDEKLFIRIHRSVIVNFEMIERIEPGGNSKYTTLLRDGTRLPLSRRKYSQLVDKLSGDSLTA